MNLKHSARYISKLANHLRRKTETFAFSREYGSAQWRTLHYILTSTHDVFQKDIEAEFCIRSSSATELLRQMENNGLITREAVEYDSRLKRVIATEKAQACQQMVTCELDELEQQIIKGIPKEKLEIYFEVAEKMMENLNEK